MIVVEPALAPVKSPELLTEATDELTDVQGFVVAAVGEPNKLEVPPTHKLTFPEIVGFSLTVNNADVLHPLILVNVIVDVPLATAVTRPFEVTVATGVSFEIQDKLAAGVVVADN